MRCPAIFHILFDVRSAVKLVNSDKLGQYHSTAAQLSTRHGMIAEHDTLQWPHP